MTGNFRILELEVRVTFKLVQAMSALGFVNFALTRPQHGLPSASDSGPGDGVVVISEVDLRKGYAVHCAPDVLLAAHVRLFVDTYRLIHVSVVLASITSI